MYHNDVLKFTCEIPANWKVKAGLAAMFSGKNKTTLAHIEGRGTATITAGALSRPELQDKQARAEAIKQELSAGPAKGVAVTVETDKPIAGEANVVAAEYPRYGVWRGAPCQWRIGRVSIVHGDLEYRIDWETAHDFHEGAQQLIASFKFDT